jgi:Flp pilus assembly protein TadD
MPGIRPWMIALLLWPVPILGAEGVPDVPADPVLRAARDAIEHRRFVQAADVLREAVERSPGNADYHNLYAYAVRKGPDPDMDLVFRHYREALRLKPEHRGAHEYLGEAYLRIGDLAKAKAQLAQLDRLCLFGCEEYSDLKKAIAEFEARARR